MESYLWDAPLNAAQELAAVLDSSGVVYERESDEFRFCFASRGCRWQVVCQGAGDRALIYAFHPASVADTLSALETCSNINSQVVEGSCFLSAQRMVFRTQAHLIEACAAREMILNALEYSAAVMIEFWGQMARGAAGLSMERSLDAIVSRFEDNQKMSGTKKF